jgi:hypothetical protein
VESRRHRWLRHRHERRQAGRTARRLVYRDARTLLRRHWTVFLMVFAAPIVAYGTFQAILFRLVPGSVFIRGFGWGLTVGLALLAVTVLLASFNLEKRLTGTQAEQWSTTELLRLEPHGWRVVNDLPADFGNIDHVVIGEHAVLAVETKVIDDSPWLDQAVERACVQAKRGADRVRLVLKQHRIDDVLVVPVVLRWGIGVGARPPVERRHDVQVMSATHADQWRQRIIDRLPSQLPSQPVLDAIERYLAAVRD